MSIFNNRLWISHFPETGKDKFSILYCIEDEGFIGFINQSEFEGEFKFCEVIVENKDKIEAIILQTDKKFTFEVKTSQNIITRPQAYATAQKF